MALLVLGAGALLDANRAGAATFWALLNPDGTGRLTHERDEPEWRVCTPDRSSCEPFKTGNEISTEGAPPGSVFSPGGDLVSPVWHGNVSARTPPSVSGEIRANELVTPVLSEWSGGWQGDFDMTQLASCLTAAGEDCTVLTEPIPSRRWGTPPNGMCAEGGTVIDPVFTGQHLRVADRRFGPSTSFNLGPWVSPYSYETWPAGPTTSVAVVGRIASATRPRTEDCGLEPLIRALISLRGVVRVKCSFACPATLIAVRGRRTVRVVREVEMYREYRGVPRLRLPCWALARLGRGRARMVLTLEHDGFNGGRTLRRVVRLRAPRLRGSSRTARLTWLAQCRAHRVREAR